MNKPDFDNLLATLYRQKSKRTPIFEFIINNPSRFKKPMIGYQPKKDKLDPFREYIHLYHRLGYDFVSLPVWEANLLSFPFSSHDEKNSRSLNVDSTIIDRNSFENYSWPDPEIGEYDVLENLTKELPDGMKFIIIGNYGVLENAVNLVGFDKLSLMLFEEPDLVKDIFNAIGSRLLRYYEMNSVITETLD